MIAWIAAFFTATSVILGLILARVMDDRDEWHKRAAAHLRDAQEARLIVVTARKALERSKKEVEQARADHASAMDRIRRARTKIDKASGDKSKVAELWNDIFES